jgi:hypothetical protein
MDTNIVYALKIIKAARAIVWQNSVSRLKHGRAYLDNKYTKITCFCAYKVETRGNMIFQRNTNTRFESKKQRNYVYNITVLKRALRDKSKGAHKLKALPRGGAWSIIIYLEERMCARTHTHIHQQLT